MFVRVGRRGDANRLSMVFRGDGNRIQRMNGGWQVEVPMMDPTAAKLRDTFGTLGRWLVACDLASCRISFGDGELTLLQPRQEYGGPDSVDALLERTVQLQIALDSRVALDLATGFVAGDMNVSFEQAFALLRDCARSRRMPLDLLATRIIETRSTPAGSDET